MKPEEALKELSYGGKCTCEARMTAIDALEKQIPKKNGRERNNFSLQFIH